ncbi:MAG: 50S ribosomal protein L3 [Clostridia bacterium]|jgi:large subunit ribosomal protein L3|nr:50S ribosomal protein L3 [Clostridia bacterium]MBQ5602192.1 50S ribosomal protein L3 [Clostridia bacterium]
MKKAIIGKKIGMTQIFDEKGNVIPVTVIEAGPCVVSQVKTAETDGYEAIQLGFEAVAQTKKGEYKANKPELGHFKKNDLQPKKHLKEFRLDDISGYKVGDTVTADIFAAGEKVDVTGITKGHGYTGAIKRWNLHKLRMTHGVGPVHRQSGSMGVIDPARIFKNKKMAGQYGNEQVTVLNLDVAKIDAEKNIIAVKGAVPGARGGIVFIRNTVKS